MTAREVIKRLSKEGYVLVRQESAHQHYKHPERPGLVTVPVHGSRDIPPRTLHSIFKQAGWK
jgi:predicted RNA binding protein YcfA (HicA-like mRNA interferase family)